MLYQQEIHLETCICATCGVPFAMPEHLQQSRRNTGREFWCPNGHTNVYTSRLKELQRKLEAQIRLTAQANAETARERAAKVETEKTFKKYKRRVTNGVCPCCQRSFLNLARHMKAKHPDLIVPAKVAI